MHALHKHRELGGSTKAYGNYVVLLYYLVRGYALPSIYEKQGQLHIDNGMLLYLSLSSHDLRRRYNCTSGRWPSAPFGIGPLWAHGRAKRARVLVAAGAWTTLESARGS